MRWLIKPYQTVIGTLFSITISAVMPTFAAAEEPRSLQLAETVFTIVDYADASTLDFIEKSEFIILGEVHAKELIDAGALASIITEYDVHILEEIRGSKLVSSIRVGHAGGNIGDTRHVISPAVPEIEVGDQVILILNRPDKTGRFLLSFFTVFKLIEPADNRPFVEPMPTGIQIYDIDDQPIDISDGMLFFDEFIHSIKKLN